VPYRGTAPMLNGILGGEVQIVADPSTTVLPHILAGKLRAIAIAGNTRHSRLPDTPTVVEAGFPYMVSPFWLAVTAPAATPHEIIMKLNGAFREAMSVPDTRKKLATFDADIKIGTPEELGQMLASERTKWNKVVKEANIKME
jgi:tripartite-type tricarboxylate transporter receptor subunit TctC